MKKLTHLFTLLTLMSLFLSSCSLFGGSAENQTLLAANQADLSGQVAINLSAEYDTGRQYNTVGQVVSIKYRVEMAKNDLTDNTPANVTFVGVTPVCPAINTVGNLDERLDTGEIFDCNLDYALTQADLDRGSLVFTATVNIYTVSSNPITTTVATVPSRALAISVTANPASYYQANQTITFTYTIKNNGTAPLGPAQFTVTDTLISASAFNCGNPDASLAAGATLNCSANYITTQDDTNKASIANNAVAAGGGANPSAAASISVAKGAAPAIAKGTTVSHTVVDGEWLWQIARCYGADPAKAVAANPQLANAAQLKKGMVVTIPNIGSNGAIHAPPEPCVTKHIVKAGDTWTSIASLYGADPGFTQYVNSNTLNVGSEVKVPHYTAGMNFQVSNTTNTTSTLKVAVTASASSYSAAGQIVTYTYVITNTGTATLGPAQFTITDTLISASAFNCGAPNTSLVTNATVSCQANYTITADDMNKASISNNATGAGGGASSSPAVSISISKSVAQIGLSIVPNPATYNAAGQVITFTYTITNTGTINLGPAQFTITDGLVSAVPFNCGDANATLAPNQTVTCTATYTVTADDLAKASISNNASASGGGAGPTQPVSVSIIHQ